MTSWLTAISTEKVISAWLDVMAPLVSICHAAGGLFRSWMRCVRSALMLNTGWVVLKHWWRVWDYCLSQSLPIPAITYYTSVLNIYRCLFTSNYHCYNFFSFTLFFPVEWCIGNIWWTRYTPVRNHPADSPVLPVVVWWALYRWATSSPTNCETHSSGCDNQGSSTDRGVQSQPSSRCLIGPTPSTPWMYCLNTAATNERFLDLGPTLELRGPGHLFIMGVSHISPVSSSFSGPAINNRAPNMTPVVWIMVSTCLTDKVEINWTASTQDVHVLFHLKLFQMLN